MKWVVFSWLMLMQMFMVTGAQQGDLKPVESQSANTSYSPAFKGQTRVAGTKTTTPYAVEVITDQLLQPWGIVGLPDGRLLVSEKQGAMRIVDLNGAVSDPISGIPDVSPRGQGGLLGLALDPKFSENRMVYWVFSEPSEAGSVTALAKGQLSDDERQITNATVIYRAKPVIDSGYHFGGRVIFDSEGHLLMSIGDRGYANLRHLTQSKKTALGKVLRLSVDGEPVASQQTLKAGELEGIYTLGHRNPQGLARHPVTGEIWQSEHGPKGGDEINRLQQGNNYGWPIITYGIEYIGFPIGDGIQQQDGLEQPVYYWDPVISPSGITFYQGREIPEWENNLFVAALSGRHIARLVIENNRVVAEERLLESENERFRMITQGADGALYAITDHPHRGKIYRLSKKP